MKTSLLFFVLLIIIANCAHQDSQNEWRGQSFSNRFVKEYSRGKLVQFSNSDYICDSFILFPGTPLLPNWAKIILFLLCFLYILLGNALLSDKLQESVYNIAQTQKVLQKTDPNTNEVQESKVTIWNKTIANLLLLSIGQGATIIMVSIISTIQNFTISPTVIGPSSIVGYCSFNLLIGFAIPVLIVNELNDNTLIKDSKVKRGEKRVKNFGVYTLVFVSNIASFIWIYLVIKVVTPNNIEIWEGIVTVLIYFFQMLVIYIFDKLVHKKRIKLGKLQNQDKSEIIDQVIEDDELKKVLRYTVLDFYKVLLSEKKGMPIMSYDEQRQRKQMKNFLMQFLCTDDILLVKYQDLKRVIEGTPVINRIKYRVDLNRKITSQRDIFNQDEINCFNNERESKQYNSDYGFKHLNYSVIEQELVCEIIVINKKGISGYVRIKSRDGTAQKGLDYQKVDRTIKFRKGQREARVKVQIMDDIEFEQDSEFYLDLYDYNTHQKYKNKDTSCSVQIVDGEKQGIISIQETNIKVLSTDTWAVVKVIRRNGCKGTIYCKYKTIQADHADVKAIPNEDYQQKEGMLEFEDFETIKEIKIRVLPKEDDEERQEVFGVMIYDDEPNSEVEISSKDTCYIQIVTDNFSQVKIQSLDQMIKMMEKKENTSWSEQFKNACMLHPTKHQKGFIEEVTNFEAVLHTITIFWKVLFSIIPNPKMCNGYPAFFMSLIITGLMSLVLIEISKLFGCVIGIGQVQVGFLFISIGVSIPDLYATIKCAKNDKYADEALFSNICTINTVSFLGFGISWIIKSLYSYNQDFSRKHQIDGSNIDYLILIYSICQILAFIIMVLKRKIFKAELGGRPIVKYPASALLTLFWISFVIIIVFYQRDKIPKFN